jgi:tripartite-type tricarboxylate transporter receptor subunit TctC
MEMFKSAAKINLTHVPYKGASPALTDLVAGNVQAAFMVPGNVQQFVKDGRLRLIASTGTKRFHTTPNVPTMIESGYPDFVATSWIGFLAPANTPKNIVERYNKEIVAILHQPDVKAKLADMEFDVIASSPEQFSDWIRSEIPRWGKVIRDTGTKAN